MTDRRSDPGRRCADVAPGHTGPSYTNDEELESEQTSERKARNSRSLNEFRNKAPRDRLSRRQECS